MVSSSAVVFLAIIAFTAATNVKKCKDGKVVEGLKDLVHLDPCVRPPCKLKKGTVQDIKIQFTPDKDIAELKTHVTAEVFGVPLPFAGVDGNSVCDKIFTDSGEKAECPLKAGVKYTYKDNFPILAIYPNLSVRVHWSLHENNEDIICFEVPAQIV